MGRDRGGVISLLDDAQSLISSQISRHSAQPSPAPQSQNEKMLSCLCLYICTSLYILELVGSSLRRGVIVLFLSPCHLHHIINPLRCSSNSTSCRHLLFTSNWKHLEQSRGLCWSRFVAIITVVATVAMVQTQPQPATIGSNLDLDQWPGGCSQQTLNSNPTQV